MNIVKAVELIRMLYTTNFRGKDAGRFALSRETLTDLLGVVYLPSDIARQLNERLAEHDMVVVDMEHVFAVLPRAVLTRLRAPTRRMITDLLKA